MFYGVLDMSTNLGKHEDQRFSYFVESFAEWLVHSRGDTSPDLFGSMILDMIVQIDPCHFPSIIQRFIILNLSHAWKLNHCFEEVGMPIFPTLIHNSQRLQKKNTNDPPTVQDVLIGPCRYHRDRSYRKQWNQWRLRSKGVWGFIVHDNLLSP